MKSIEHTSLYYSEWRSDKEYHAEIVEVADGHVVNYRYGRPGAALTVGTKTLAPVNFAQAKKIYDKLVKENVAKGYTPDVSGCPLASTIVNRPQCDRMGIVRTGRRLPAPICQIGFVVRKHCIV
jgi:bifunctional non-homologous end joining protein LigD